jgi:hypothetical protein
MNFMGNIFRDLSTTPYAFNVIRDIWMYAEESPHDTEKWGSRGSTARLQSTMYFYCRDTKITQTREKFR